MSTSVGRVSKGVSRVDGVVIVCPFLGDIFFGLPPPCVLAMTEQLAHRVNTERKPDYHHRVGNRSIYTPQSENRERFVQRRSNPTP